MCLRDFSAPTPPSPTRAPAPAAAAAASPPCIAWRSASASALNEYCRPLLASTGLANACRSNGPCWWPLSISTTSS
eukprot:scaffold3736_cov74-Phaeocystis_antarctica.AAC.3